MRPAKFILTIVIPAIAWGAAIAGGWVHLTMGPPAQRVSIRWAASVNGPDRARLEMQLGLADGVGGDDRTWSYRLRGRSRASIAAVVANPLVEDTSHIDRTAFRVEVEPSPHLPSLVRQLIASGQLFFVSFAFGLIALVTTWRGRRELIGTARAGGDGARDALGRAAAVARQRLRALISVLDLRRRYRAEVLIGVTAGAILVLTVGAQMYDSNYYLLFEATSLLAGDHPYRDFFEWGAPLAAYMSALAQIVARHRLVGEFAQQWLFIVAGVLIAFRVGRKLSRSVSASLMAMTIPLVVLAYTPTYHYTKLFSFPLGILVGCHYIAKPGPWRAATLGAVTSIAFLLRHDYGLYLFIGSTMALLAGTLRDPGGVLRLLRSVAAYALAAILVVLPWVVAVEANEGLLEYVSVRVQRYPAPEGGPAFAALLRMSPQAWGSPLLWLRQMTLVVPLLLLLSAGLQIRRGLRNHGEMPSEALQLGFAALFLVVVDSALIREPAYFCVSAPLTGALSACLITGVADESERIRRFCRIGSGFLWLLTLAAALAWVRPSNLLDPGELMRTFRGSAAALWALPPTVALAPYDPLVYMHDCTAAGDRLLVTGSTPLQVNFYVGRPVAGGQLNWRQRWRSGAKHEAEALNLLKHQSVPFVFSTNDPALKDFEAYPGIHEYLATNYVELQGSQGRLLVDVRRRPTGYFGPQRFPCFS